MSVVISREDGITRSDAYRVQSIPSLYINGLQKRRPYPQSQTQFLISLLQIPQLQQQSHSFILLLEAAPIVPSYSPYVLPVPYLQCGATQLQSRY
jgi:hypothetical protein